MIQIDENIFNNETWRGGRVRDLEHMCGAEKDKKIFNNEKWIGGRARDLEHMCGGEKSKEKKKKKINMRRK